MAAWYEHDLTCLAFCWRLQRRDGAALGFTSHDRDLTVGGLRYRSTPGIVPSAIERNADLEASTVDIAGALTSDLITEADLDAGRWDGARIRVMAVNWELPDDDPFTLISGSLGRIESDGQRFQAELLGVATILDSPIVEETSPECRASLGDKRCRVDLAGRKLMARVVASSGAVVAFDAALGGDDRFGWGGLRWLDGENAGLEAAIIASGSDSVELREVPPFAVSAGVWAELTEGCDKRFSTCAGRFGNVLNFRGEPHLPGNDLLLRYAR